MNPARRAWALLATVAALVPGGLRAQTEGPRLAQAGGRLQLRSADATVLREWPLAAAVAAQARHAGRRSLLAALRGVPELWEVQLAPDAPPVYDGLVHDWRLGEGLASPGHLGVRRTPLAQPLAALWVDSRVPWVLALAEGRPGELLVIHLDVRRVLARWPWPPGARWDEVTLHTGPEPRLRLPGAAGPLFVDTARWHRVEGPGRP